MFHSFFFSPNKVTMESRKSERQQSFDIKVHKCFFFVFFETKEKIAANEMLQGRLLSCSFSNKKKKSFIMTSMNTENFFLYNNDFENAILIIKDFRLFL